MPVPFACRPRLLLHPLPNLDGRQHQLRRHLQVSPVEEDEDVQCWLLVRVS